MIRKLLVLAALAALAACSPQKKAPGAPADSGAVAKNHAAGDAFLAKNAKEAGVMTLPSGLQYKVVREGPAGGVHPRPQDEVRGFAHELARSLVDAHGVKAVVVACNTASAAALDDLSRSRSHSSKALTPCPSRQVGYRRWAALPAPSRGRWLWLAGQRRPSC